MGNPIDWLRAFRPQHWVKNVFVLAPLVFSHRAGTLSQVTRAGIAFTIFSLLASAVYLFNDVRDRKRDAAHPKKSKRPIAAGRIKPGAALMVSALLAVCGVFAAYRLDWRFGVVAALYLTNNLFYCLGLKNKVVADVLSISIGFMLRFIGGAYAIDVQASRWLLVCGFALSLFLAFGKRRAELTQLADRSGATRPVLLIYDEAKLDSALAVTNSLCILSYLLFTTDDRTGHPEALVYTAPLVVYCLIRFMFKVQEGSGTGPVEILLHDRAFLVAGALWLAVVAAILYVPAFG